MGVPKPINLLDPRVDPLADTDLFPARKPGAPPAQKTTLLQLLSYISSSLVVNNGLSKDLATGLIPELGQSIGQPGDPGALLDDREIPMGTFFLILKGLGDAAGKFALEGATVDNNKLLIFTDSAGVEVGAIRIDGTKQSLFFGLDSGSVATGALNTAFGKQALKNITTGDGNTALGLGALSGLTTGIRNIGIGPGAMQSVAAANFNIVIGRDSLDTSGAACGDFNVIIGNDSFNLGGGNTVGSQNIVLGQFSTNNIGSNVGDFNIIIGNSINLGGGILNTILILAKGTGAAPFIIPNVVLLGDNTQNVLIGSDPLATTDNGRKLQISGSANADGLALNIRPVTLDTNFDFTDYTILVDATAGDVTVTVDPTLLKGTAIGNIKKTDASANNVIISVTGGTIQAIGAPAATLTFNTQGQSVTFQSDGTNLFVL